MNIHNAGPKRLNECLIDAINDFGKGITGIRTGFKLLDEATLGFQKSELIIVAARPSVGKTSLLIDMMLNAAKTNPVALFSLEMSETAIAQRTIANEAGFSLHRARLTGLTETEQAIMSIKLAEILNREIYIDDLSSLSPGLLAERLKKIKIDCAFIDYIQLMRLTEKKESRAEELGIITKGLKAVAKQAKIPIVLGCQINRTADDGKNSEPRLSQLKSSGAIEEDADVVILIHRPNFNKCSSNSYEEAYLIIAKNRNGPRCKLKVEFNTAAMTFKE